MASVTIIVPVKDEEVGLRFLLEDYQRSSFADEHDADFIFVVDGRTSDSSVTIANQFSQTVIDQSSSHGKGAAIKQAVQSWISDPSPYVIFMDADGSYGFDSVSSLIGELQNGADVVSGSRFLKSSGRPEGMSLLHNFGNKALSIISSLRNRRKITDLCTGLWGFKSEALQKIEIRSDGFDLEAELAGRIRRIGLKHREVPVDWSQRKGGISKLRSLTDGTIILIRILFT